MQHTTNRNRLRVVRGALLASAAALASSPAVASDLKDFRLALIHDALMPRTSVARELIRLSKTPQLKAGAPELRPGSSGDGRGAPPQAQTHELSIPGGPR